mmetsp:Transcript_14183/g.31373  ORF Transcript_14183/g.31373 Transcript_14183/m.31373 type:complete len:84 (+) Transcript_14183:626-877(+)
MRPGNGPQSRSARLDHLSLNEGAHLAHEPDRMKADACASILLARHVMAVSCHYSVSDRLLGSSPVPLCTFGCYLILSSLEAAY